MQHIPCSVAGNNQQCTASNSYQPPMDISTSTWTVYYQIMALLLLCFFVGRTKEWSWKRKLSCISCAEHTTDGTIFQDHKHHWSIFNSYCLSTSTAELQLWGQCQSADWQETMLNTNTNRCNILRHYINHLVSAECTKESGGPDGY